MADATDSGSSPPRTRSSKRQKGENSEEADKPVLIECRSGSLGAQMTPPLMFPTCWCKLLSKSAQNQNVIIHVPLFTVGSGNHCDLRLSDQTCSETLCQIKCVLLEGRIDALLEITGMEPVQVNGKFITKLHLNSGDELVFGSQGSDAYIFQQLITGYQYCVGNLNVRPSGMGRVQHASASAMSPWCAAFKEEIHSGILDGKNSEVSFENFPYYLSEYTKEALKAALFLHFKKKGGAKFISKLNTVNPCIMLSGPAGSEIYQEALVKALANYYGAKFLIFDNHMISGVLPSKEADDLKNETTEDEMSDGGAESILVKVLFEAVYDISRISPFILFIRDVEISVVGNSNAENIYSGNSNLYYAFKSSLENLPDNVVIIYSHTEADNQKDKECIGKLCGEGKETSTFTRSLSDLFPNEIEIFKPQDKALLEFWRRQLERDADTFKVKANLKILQKVLHQSGLNCEGLETLYINDQTLTHKSADKVVGCALTHYMMKNPHLDPDAVIMISKESIKYGIDTLLGGQNYTRCMKKSLKDVVPENEFEMGLLAEVIPPSDVNIPFDDTGALEDVKDTLKDLVSHALQRPKLSSKRQLTEVTKGLTNCYIASS